MAEKYTVLRSIRAPRAADPFGGGMLGPMAATVEAGPPEARVETAELTLADIADLQHDAEVVAVAPVMPLRLIKPRFQGGAAVQPASGSTTWGVRAVGADTSHFTGRDVKVAVLDTGIDADHPAFAGVALEQRDFTGDGDGDVNGHGTHCAGTVFGRDVTGVRIGVARGVRRALIGKVLADDGSGESEWLYDAIDWALQNGCRVISLSLSFDFPGFVERLVQAGFKPAVATSKALEGYRANLRVFDALMTLARAREAIDGGALLVAACGNENGADENPPYEISVSIPAAATGVVSVGALGENPTGFVVAPFSNTLPEVVGPGVDVISAKSGGGLVSFDGTSMATPHVAGVAALWWEALQAAGVPSTARHVLARLVASARTTSLAPGSTAATRGAGLIASPV